MWDSTEKKHDFQYVIEQSMKIGFLYKQFVYEAFILGFQSR